MLKLKRATPDDRQAIIKIWQAEFGDEVEFIDDFCDWCGWEQIFVMRDDDEPCSMIAAPLVDVVLADGRTVRAGYIYALTTLREFRGKGLARMGLNYADFCLQNRGADCAVLVPAQPSLFPYFATAGYETAFYMREDTVDAADIGAAAPADELWTVSAEEYRVLREGCLRGLPHMVSPLGLLEQQKKLCVASGADLYALKLPHGRGCAAAERQKDGSVILRELLVPVEDRDAALAALHACLNAQRYVVRSRLSDAEGDPDAKPFGVIKWYGQENGHGGSCCCSYLGPALD